MTETRETYNVDTLDNLRQQLAGYRYAIEGLRNVLEPLLAGTPLAGGAELAADPLNVVQTAVVYLQGHQAGLAAVKEIKAREMAGYINSELADMAQQLAEQYPLKVKQIEEQARQIAGLKAQLAALTGERPPIVCLCGSTRFWRTFQEASLQETLTGKIVLSIGAASGTDDQHFGNLPREKYDRVKADLDALHCEKIRLADEVLILNCGGYIGESTGGELALARQLGKVVRFWEATDGEA